eukprot:6368341-Prymnesium_polylepis.1
MAALQWCLNARSAWTRPRLAVEVVEEMQVVVRRKFSSEQAQRIRRGPTLALERSDDEVDTHGAL